MNFNWVSVGQRLNGNAAATIRTWIVYSYAQEFKQIELLQWVKFDLSQMVEAANVRILPKFWSKTYENIPNIH